MIVTAPFIKNVFKLIKIKIVMAFNAHMQPIIIFSFIYIQLNRILQFNCILRPLQQL